MSENQHTACAPQERPNTLLGHTFAGYQAWFHTSEDLDGFWGHWSHGGAPEEENEHNEMFADFSEYPESCLRATRLPRYPDGREVKMYEAHDPAAIDVHFRWMETYGLDGVGVQRFYGNTSATPLPEPTHLTVIRDAAERHGRLFYIMYDTSGCGHDGAAAVDRFQADVLHNVEEKGLIDSPAYVYADGRPVICLWGLAPTEPGRYPVAADALRLIDWLHARGYYVIGGLPDNSWAEEDGDYAAVYAALDMLSPWTPGRFGPDTLGDWVEDHLARDLRYCRAHNKAYQPVMHAGFAWSNFCGGGNPNASPRMAGTFLWEQARRYAAAGVTNAYFAMFDEYDEATALAKAASDSYDLPEGESYFQTLSADGYWLSRDFYLRLAGAVTAMLRGERPITDTVPIPHSEGPVYWRNGFEQREARVKLTRSASTDRQRRPVDVCDAHAAVLSREAVQIETAAVVRGRRGEVCYTGRYGFAFSGYAMQAGTCRAVYRLAKTAIPVVSGLVLRYRMKALNAAGDRVGVDLLLGDGTRLSAHIPAVTQPKGSVPAGQNRSRWVQVTQPLEAVAGQTIEAVLLTYEAAGEARFDVYLDDVEITVE